jgi:hypothetical protein
MPTKFLLAARQIVKRPDIGQATFGEPGCFPAEVIGEHPVAVRPGGRQDESEKEGKFHGNAV